MGSNAGAAIRSLATRDLEAGLSGGQLSQALTFEFRGVALH